MNTWKTLYRNIKITSRIARGWRTLTVCPCVCLEKWAVRKKLGTNILLTCEKHKGRWLTKCYLWFVGVTFARLGRGGIGIITCIVVVWAREYTCVGSTAEEIMEEISRIVRDNEEELKEVVHVGDSHSPEYTWHSVVTKLFLVYLFADSNERLQFWKGTGLLMKEVSWADCISHKCCNSGEELAFIILLWPYLGNNQYKGIVHLQD